MSDLHSVPIGAETDRAKYRARRPADRAQDAQELANEVLDHYDHVRPLLAAVVESLRELSADEAKPVLQLAEVAEAWLNDAEHVAQEHRLFACLHANVEACFASREENHG